MQRREFLHKVTFSSGIIVAGCIPYGLARLLAPEIRTAPVGTHLRPPGAVADETAFIEACIGCGLCAEVCPPLCIRFDMREGGDGVNTPYINPEEKACTLCGKCMEACPTEALTQTPLEKVTMGIAQIDRAACYPWVDKGICGACISICPLGERAINFAFANMYRPVVQQGCVGCGLCVEICPEPSLPIRIVKRNQGTVAGPI
ncbi:MAG: 4Fe-4S dicluster domain-containing protein [Gammaproteobacteria bacterium]